MPNSASPSLKRDLKPDFSARCFRRRMRAGQEWGALCFHFCPSRMALKDLFKIYPLRNRFDFH